MAHQDALNHAGWSGPRETVGATGSALALTAGAGILAAGIMGYLEAHGPSGSSPGPWSYTGNGALAVFAYVPLILMAGWSVLLVWQRGYLQPVAIITGLAVLLTGAIAGLVNEIGVVGQLPDTSRTVHVYSPVANSVVAGLALVVALTLASRFGKKRRRQTVLAVLPALVAVGVALVLSLKEGVWYGLSFTQSLLVPLTIVVPLAAGQPRADVSHPRVSRVITAVVSVLVPVALVGGFMLEELVAGLGAG
jgi:hypothetical protein